ncbi:AT hook domain-containing protein [Colletotrichum paranaense]|uniref:AT hook domain-containing protein n=1 Tax=Colletotrichum paranaense TaxID=1914294 RepID=A0ABQ9T5U6_9PEZI|nr:AT hook domain-containing protein [Colletotrichum paranaense]KAK1547144.1 AT hook domain-containing protein [Colletotrichum paranaense]
MTTRGERMQQRMRGAGHGQIDDVSFQLDFGDDLTTEIEAQTSPERPPPRPTPTPNTSAKRRRLDSETARPGITEVDNVSQTQKSPGKPDVYELQEETSTESAQATVAQPAARPDAVVEAGDPDSVESLPPPRPAPSASFVSPVSRRMTADNTEVEESPADAPGSGRRRRITTSSAVASSARLQEALSPGENATETVPISSPLERKVRRNTTSTRRSTLSSRGSRNSAASANEDLDELSPDRTANSVSRTRSPELSYRGEAEPEEEEQEASEVPADVSERARANNSQTESILGPELDAIVDEVLQQEQDHNESLAEEVGAKEAAQQLGRKRPRTSPRRSSPEPDSMMIEEEQQEEPVPKRRRKQAQESPAKQKQGRPKAVSKGKAASTAKNASPKAAPKRRKKSGSDGVDEAVSIPVQRFTKRVQVAEGGDDEADVLAMDIPFAGRGGVNTVDVLTHTCDEIIETSIETLKEGVRNAQDASTKREHRVQQRALEAYQDELRTRLLQHTILLDTLHSLRKRVRSVQKERITLRDEIMRIRAERDQVALRKDAVRIKHERVTEEALVMSHPHPAQKATPHTLTQPYELFLTGRCVMHDIDMAVERGRAAPELSPAEKKTAELANLEILISRITDQACTRSDTGGTLKQVKDFNAFLERAAVALEGR